MSLAKPLIWIFMLLLTSLVEAAVYKWVDEQGRVHYGDKPTSDNASEVKIKEQNEPELSADSIRRHDKQQRFLRAREEDRKEKKQAHAKEKREKIEAKRKCTQARKSYDKYSHASTIYVKGKSGEREHLSFKEREAYEKSLAAKVKKWCK